MKIILAFFMMVSTLFGAPALQKERTYTQADGSTFLATPKGDEYLHFLQTQSGDIVVFNKETKNYEYATIKGEKLAPSGKVYRQNSLYRAIGLADDISKPTQKQLQELWVKRYKKLHSN